MPQPNTNSTPVTIPPGSPITVKLINPVNFGPSHLHRFMSPAVPGLETFARNPSFSFLLEHSSGRKLVFDLGIRKDWDGYAPKIAEYIPTTGYRIEIKKDVMDVLVEGGVKLDEVEGVIWSHWHWDHIGDPSTFPPSTDLIVGPGFKDAMLPGYPANPESPIRESDYSNRTLREISFFPGPQSLQIGQFRAYDYFGDGSFYLLDSPGHAIGHLCGLARTTGNSDTFVLLGGDIAHYTGIFRPSTLLPLPTEIIPHPFCHTGLEDSFCPGAAWEELQFSRGRAKEQSLFNPTFGDNIPLAIETIRQLQELDCDEDIFVIIAHDFAVRDGVPHFPENLNDWKERGLGRKLKWAFLRDLEGCWKDKGLMG
ncbi:MBL fold metallo-hydrolase [Aspergillus stella-maris]|uniref:MBL fold metallo-hydrolase n=1 Tax=Aspergillus stella-maris TaxID=1810926 RepID=UPI003CCE1401